MTSQSMKGNIEHTTLRTAAKRFHLDFPNFEKARRGVGHRAEHRGGRSPIGSEIDWSEFEASFCYASKIFDRLKTLAFGVH
jgi:hypothetical protein